MREHNEQSDLKESGSSRNCRVSSTGSAVCLCVCRVLCGKVGRSEIGVCFVVPCCSHGSPQDQTSDTPRAVIWQPSQFVYRASAVFLAGEAVLFVTALHRATRCACGPTPPCWCYW